jgi:hypothetical protein
MRFDHANAAMNLYAAEIVLVLVATVLILAVCLIRERLTTQRRLKDMYDRIQGRYSNLNQELESTRDAFRQSGNADQSAAKSSLTMDENIVAAARAAFMDLHSRVVTLESRADAMDLLLVGLLKTLIKSQSLLQVSGAPVETTSNPMQELEFELEAMRNQNSTLRNVAISKGQNREQIAATEAGFSTEEYKIGNLLRRLATFDEVLLTKPR